MAKDWPEALPVVQFRMSHPTSRLESVAAFYRDGLGLPVIYSYEHDADYDGVMFGLPGRAYHLEITQHQGDGPCPLPSPDSLLVFYIVDRAALGKIVERLEKMGYQPMPPRNPYWAAKGITFADPDGWHTVLMNTPGFGEDIE
jgi:catechol 2,3-dioxygenase-like lactoylglutathione lyase family enzyme